ncbi:MAG: hypothetical protein KatS3mg020_0735 [Fimbriimonadales bacterium]|nr:MAG: hypothetical protein KatS3mg020_0735 [Fimbriimonadales bacterium]
MHTTLKTTTKKHKLILSGEIGFAQTNELWDAVQQIAQQPKDDPS